MLELILRFREQDTKEARESIGMGRGWPAIGLPSGFQPAVFPPNVPQLPSFHGHTNKQDELEEQRKSGMPIQPRKCKVAPRVPACVCPHPKESLCGEANQYQKAVWCQDCHARWKVATTASPFRLQSVPGSLTSRSPGTPSSVQGTASPMSNAAASEELMKCKCGLPANRLRVKKEGATKGRHFFKCPAQVCEYFAWDPVELEQLKRSHMKEPEISPEITKLKEEVAMAKKELSIREGSLKEREDSVLMMQQSLHEGARNLVGTVVEQAEQRHQEVMESQMSQHQSQLEQLQSQLFWLTALAGEARVEEVMRDPEKSQEVMRQAIELRDRMMTGPQTEGQIPK